MSPDGTTVLYVSLLPPPVTALSSSGKREKKWTVIIPRPSVKPLQLDQGFTNEAPAAGRAGLRNVFKLAEIMTQS